MVKVNVDQFLVCSSSSSRPYLTSKRFKLELTQNQNEKTFIVTHHHIQNQFKPQFLYTLTLKIELR